MAVRRMFSREICETDAFLDLPATAQRLYFFLGLQADDEGFLQNANSVVRLVGSSRDDLNILSAKRFIIPFESGVIVIRHWRQHNYVPKDRFHATRCLNEKSLLRLDSTSAYELHSDSVYKLDTRCIQSVGDPYPEGRGGKVRGEEEESSPAPSSVESDILSRVEEHQHADDLMRRYQLPDGDTSREALLEDAERVGWTKLEEALQASSRSNSRQRLSVNFYRRFLNDAPTGGGMIAIDNPY